MKDYLLFIDTEASGVPKSWIEPYAKKGNWPYSVQVSWLVYSSDGKEIKREDHYIGDQDFKISDSSIKIHGITRSYLDTHGENRKTVMQLLADDLNRYTPLVIGHFMEFDYHVLAADFFRSDIQNPIATNALPVFCTMVSTTRFMQNPIRKFMKLGELYQMLFNKQLEKPHNAIYDAKATADCFFELLKRGELTRTEVEQQKLDLTIKQKDKGPFWLLLAISLLLILFIAVNA
ncbi:3'-5' exonuclease [Pedobacter sp. SYSU D00535]|uniref:3'-5' exonuclease n=1 Tax=Pedobacter sp. SYSU D00535 TaxID=2810308 RepID=UPI001A96C60D